MNFLRGGPGFPGYVAFIAHFAVQFFPGPCRLRNSHYRSADDRKLLETSGTDIKNPNAVFKALPSNVTVYPTASYYHFAFPYNGIIARNLCSMPGTSSMANPDFAYFPEYASWSKPLDPFLQKAGSARWGSTHPNQRVPLQDRFQGKATSFDIPDPSNVQPAFGNDARR